MSSYSTLVKATCLLTVLVIVASCLRQDPEVSTAEANPFETIRQLSAGIKPATPLDSARDRCLAKQRARLEGCGKQHGQERAICEAVAHELLSVCEQINPQAPAFLANGLFCSGVCAVRQCRPVCNIPGGTGVCLGNICAAENSVCDPGVLFDCNCVTSVVGPPLTQSNFCSCSCT